MQDLVEAGHRLAIASYRLDPAVIDHTIDLCDPATLARLAIPPDTLAARDRAVTQAIADRIHRAGHAGFRWWSGLIGEWHTAVLFTDRLPLDALTPAPPILLTTAHPAVLAASHALGIRTAP